MKKNVLSKITPLFLCLLALVMVSCGGDDEALNDNMSMLYGDTWSFSKAVVDINGTQIPMSLSDIRKIYKNELGMSNVMFVDQYLRFDENYMTLVNAGEKVKYMYYANGSLWLEGLDEINNTGEISFDVKISSLTSTQLVFHYVIGVSGMTIYEDLYYTR